MEKIRLGVIGLGMIGKLHAETLRKQEDIAFAAASDADPNHRKTAESLGVPFYRSFEEMLEQVPMDGVIAAVPNDQHLPVGEACAARGVHILMEKPIAPDLESAESLIQAARKNRVHLLVGHHRRYNPHIRELRRIVRDGELGQVLGAAVHWAMYKPENYFQEPFTWRSLPGGGPIRINLIHEIDNLRFICGDIARVYAEVSSLARGFPVEDTVCVSLRMKSGASASIFLTDCAPSPFSYEATTGENPFFYRTNRTCYHYFGTEGSITFPDLRKNFYRDPAKKGWQYPLCEEGCKVDFEDPYSRQIRHFAAVIQGREEPVIDGEDAKKTLEVTLGIQKSGETGQAVVFS
jgi:predicted dehydrogenase